MASAGSFWIILAAAAALISTFSVVKASDPDLTMDYPAADAAKTNASFFTFTGFRDGVTAPEGKFLVRKATAVEFGALFGLGISAAKLSFQAESINPPHTHPRGTELLFLQSGCLSVGLIDSTNKLFVQELRAGDLFVFPKGLVHFQMNRGKVEAKALSAFSSANSGTVSLPTSLFATNIDDALLSKAFKVPVDVIQQLKYAAITA